jgi:hypothetical protein
MTTPQWREARRTGLNAAPFAAEELKRPKECREFGPRPLITWSHID